jgi:hypothetical protein
MIMKNAPIMHKRCENRVEKTENSRSNLPIYMAVFKCTVSNKIIIMPQKLISLKFDLDDNFLTCKRYNI